MPEQTGRIAAVFTRMALFRDLDPERIAVIASDVEQVFLDPGEVLYRQGEPGESFYVVIHGKLEKSRGRGKTHRIQSTLVAGDFLGEESLLSGRPRTATATAIAPTILAKFSKRQFQRMIRAYPEIRNYLKASVETKRLTRSSVYDWLNEGETIYLTARKHHAYLIVSLIPPVLLGWLAIAALYFSMREGYEAIASVAGWIGYILFAAAAGWGIWRYFDWGNDYYVVTNQRVIWIEKVILLYDSRQEAPMSTILTVGFVRDFLGQLLGYANIVIRTYTGQIVLENVGFPEEVVGLIEEQLARSRVTAKRMERAALKESIRKHLLTPTSEQEELPVPIWIRPKQAHKETRWHMRFVDVFKVRVEENGVITFRKHWLLLVRHIWLPTILILLLMYILVARLSGRFDFLSVQAVTLFTVTFMVIIALWWVYEYVNWANDIYQITDEQVIDIYRTPLGREDKKTAQLENILSLEHNRIGILGLLFNFGDVNIMVGSAKFDFVGVYNPAAVRQEIFAKMNMRKQRIAEAQAAAERERIADWLQAYHEESQDLGDLENPTNFDLNTG